MGRFRTKSLSWILFLLLMLMGFLLGNFLFSSTEIRPIHDYTQSLERKVWSPRSLKPKTERNISSFYRYIYLEKETKKSCETIHIQTMCLNADDTRNSIDMLKTILYFRTNPVYIHYIVSESQKSTLDILFDTWELPLFTHNLHVLSNLSNFEIPSQVQRIIYHIKETHEDEFNNSTNKVLIVNPSVRFVGDIRHLWEEFDNMEQDEDLGLIRWKNVTTDGNDTITHKGFYYNVMAMKFSQSNTAIGRTLNVSLTTTNVSALQSYLDDFLEQRLSMIHQLPCSWEIRPKSTMCQESKNDTRLWFSSHHYGSSTLVNVELTELVDHILESSGQLLAALPAAQDCLEEGYVPPYEPLNISDVDIGDKCTTYHYAAVIKRRTHVNFIRRSVYEALDDLDVTLLTQFTTDRFSVFARMVDTWRGPISAVLYATDEEALTFLTSYKQTASLHKRTNLAVHVVYKRGMFYPINYLRNVALGQVVTAFSWFVDVDLVPRPGSYAIIRKMLYSTPNRTKVALVTPAFEAFVELNPFPQNREALISYIDGQKVQGYKMDRPWNLGHKPTNYTKWRRSAFSYEVPWKESFEPYMVLPTFTSPKYPEHFFERMADKIMYTAHIHALGYRLVVMSEVFVVHLPHPISEGTRLWHSSAHYRWCGVVFKHTFYRELTEKYNVTISKIK